MLSAVKSLRPNCDQILREKSSWALDINEIDSEFSLSSLTAKSIEDSFQEFFIKTKLKFRYSVLLAPN